MTSISPWRTWLEASAERDSTSCDAWLAERGWSPSRAKVEYQRLTRPWREPALDESPLRLEPVTTQHSQEGQTTKVLFRLPDGREVESVLMRHHGRRNTVCLSSQAGCAFACAFCATGRAGFGRHLSALEILEQALYFARSLAAQGERVTNLVFMGMGEPLANLPNVLNAIRMLTDDAGLAVARRRATVSTVGLAPEIDILAEAGLGVNLAISLHAPDDALRDSLMPINHRYPLAELLAAARRYAESVERVVMIEYLMLAGTNDQDVHAHRLAEILGPGFHVNLIPFNPTPGSPWLPSEDGRTRAFQAILREAGLPVTVRVPMGRDITAACGQLRVASRRSAP